MSFHLAVVGTAALMSLSACGGRSAATTPGPGTLPPRPVELVAATLTPLAEQVTAHGTLAADEDVDLAFEYAGTLATMPVDIGSQVAGNDTLATLDTTDAELAVRVAEGAVRQARARLGLPPAGDDDKVDPEQTPQVRQAQATLTEARLALARIEELRAQSLMAEAELESARAAHEVAQSRLASAYNDVRDHVVTLSQRRVEADLARRKIAQSHLLAPFAGVVAARLKSPPEYVRAGDPVLTLLRTDPLRLRLRIPERDAGAIRTSQRVRFTAEGIAGEHQGEVARLSPQIDPETRTLLIEATVANATGILRPGLFARAAVEVSAPVPRVTLPRSAVVAFAGVEKVFVVDGDVVKEQLVQTGRRAGEMVEITQGLAAQARVVLAAEGLVSGARVTVAP
jgi:multidrug efflux pump subunit AcrA (membrane-fusion protein)